MLNLKLLKANKNKKKFMINNSLRNQINLE